RRPGNLEYEDIPSTHWRSTALHMIPDERTLWKMLLLPRGGAQITPDGKAIGDDPAATARTAKIQEYDSIIIKARQFEKLWPRKDVRLDAVRRKYLQTARKARVDPNEIAKLKQD